MLSCFKFSSTLKGGWPCIKVVHSQSLPSRRAFAVFMRSRRPQIRYKAKLDYANNLITLPLDEYDYDDASGL